MYVQPHMEKIRITKKDLKDRSYETTYTGVGVRIATIWFDRHSGEYKENGVIKTYSGFKYMVAIHGGTKKQALDHMHRWLNNGMIGYDPHIKVWTAAEDKDRRRVPVGFNWSHW